MSIQKVVTHRATTNKHKGSVVGLPLLAPPLYRPDLFSANSHLVQKCYAHYRLYRLHPLVGKSYRCPIPVTQIRADLKCQQSSATAKSCHPESCLDWVSQSTVFYAVALLCWHLRSARICVTAIGRR